MKIISSIKKTAIIAALVFGAVSCGDDDDGNVIEVTANITATAAADGDLESLVLALEAADLLGTLNGDGPFTVLAPTNEAFATFLSANGWADLSDVPTDALRQVLLNHVIAGEVTSSTLTANGAGYASTSSTAGPGGTNLSLYYNTADGVSFNGASDVVAADIRATNGIIHKVDAVIGLPNLTTFVAADPNFSSLLGALQAADLVATVEGFDTATVFAPNDAAFQALLDSNDDWNTLADIPSEIVVAALQLHIINGVNVTSEDLANVAAEQTTVGGGIITLDAANTTVQAEGNAEASNIIATDVQAVNGIIHAIDQVLLPAM